MRKPEVVRLGVGFSLLFVVILAVSATVFANSKSKITLNNGNATPTTSTGSLRQSSSAMPAEVPMQSIPPHPIVVPMQHMTPTPTTVPTQPATTPTPTTVPTQSAPSPSQPPATTQSDRYFPPGTPLATIQSSAATLTKQQVKVLIEQQVDSLWAVLQSRLGFSTKEKAYAFFLGMATRESTFNAALETGSGPSHSYGPLQAAEPAYANTHQNYSPENDVPGVLQYDFTPQNFYDPGIATHMGIRHLLHFASQASVSGYTGTELLRHALIGYNTGVITTSNPAWMQQYSDEIGALAGWYLSTGHLYDSAFTWTGDPAVDRTNYWGWY